MIDPSEFDLAQFRFEIRKLYQQIGLEGSLQVLYEMLLAAKIAAEVIQEEKDKNADKN